jgi:hypothetical protein
MGARRETLGKIEEEWGTLMFFLNSHKKDRRCVVGLGPTLTGGVVRPCGCRVGVTIFMGFAGGQKPAFEAPRSWSALGLHVGDSTADGSGP